MNNSKSFNYRVNVEEETIGISNTFARAAGKPGSNGYKQYMRLRKQYPGYRFVIYDTVITESKQTYGKLTFAEMRRCIIEWDGEGSANLATLDKAIADKVPYPKVKQWYLNIYGDRYKRPTDVSMPIEEDTAAVGNADTAAANC